MTDEQNNQLEPWEAFKGQHYPFSLEGHYQPWYDDRRDYNTNAPTYYDYLSNINKIPKAVVDLVNAVARRNVEVQGSNCLAFTKEHDWIKEGDGNSFHDVITLKSDVILSQAKQDAEFNAKFYQLENAIQRTDQGLFTPNLRPILEQMQSDLNELGKHHTDYVTYNDQKIFQLTTKMEELENKYSEMTTKYTILVGAVQKFIDNLNYNGNATTNNIETFELVDGIACGNINLWGGTAGGGSLIRTHNGVHENDVAIGHI
jgi:hypothetical protein